MLCYFLAALVHHLDHISSNIFVWNHVSSETWIHNPLFARIIARNYQDIRWFIIILNNGCIAIIFIITIIHQPIRTYLSCMTILPTVVTLHRKNITSIRLLMSLSFFFSNLPSFFKSFPFIDKPSPTKDDLCSFLSFKSLKCKAYWTSSKVKDFLPYNSFSLKLAWYLGKAYNNNAWYSSSMLASIFSKSRINLLNISNYSVKTLSSVILNEYKAWLR